MAWFDLFILFLASFFAGCVDTVLRIAVRVGASLSTPTLELVHAVGDSARRVAAVSGAPLSFASSTGRAEVYAPDARVDVAVTLTDAAGAVLYSAPPCVGGRHDVTRAFIAVAAASGEGGVRGVTVTTTAAGYGPGVAGPFDVRVDGRCAAPMLPRQLFARSGDVIVVPRGASGDGGAALHVIAAGTGALRLFALPSPDGGSSFPLPISAGLRGEVLLEARSLGWAPSPPTPVHLHVDHALPAPAPNVEWLGHPLSSKWCNVLSGEPLALCGSEVPGYVVTVTIDDDDGNEIVVTEFPALYTPPAGCSKLVLVASAPGTLSSKPLVLAVDSKVPAAPALASAPLHAGAVCVSRGDALTFTRPTSRLPGAALQLACDGLAAPITLDGASVPVAAFCGGGGAGTEVAVSVCEVAPGCIPGPPLRFRVCVDVALPVAEVVDRAGVRAGDGALVLFNALAVRLPFAARPADAALHIALRGSGGGSGSGGGGGGGTYETIVPLEGRTEVWGPLPAGDWTSLTLSVVADGCVPAASPPTSVRVSSAAALLVSMSAGLKPTVAASLEAAGFTSISSVLALTQQDMRDAGLTAGEVIKLSAPMQALRKAPPPIEPPPLPAPDATFSWAVTPPPAGPATFTWGFASEALRGEAPAIVAAAAAFMLKEDLDEVSTLAALADDTGVDGIFAAGGIARGHRVRLIAALHNPAVVRPPPLPTGARAMQQGRTHCAQQTRDPLLRAHRRRGVRVPERPRGDRAARAPRAGAGDTVHERGGRARHVARLRGAGCVECARARAASRGVSRYICGVWWVRHVCMRSLAAACVREGR